MIYTGRIYSAWVCYGKVFSAEIIRALYEEGP